MKIGGIKSKVVRALAAGGFLVVLVGGGAYAITRGPAGTPGEAARAAGQTTAPTTVARSSTSGAPTTTTPPTTVPPDTTTTAAAAPAKAQSVESTRQLQQRLADLGYDIGPIDGLWGSRTYYTVMAFQKIEGLSRTGEDSDGLREALAKASKPGPAVPAGDPNRVEVDLDRQVLLLWNNNVLTRVLSVSTGSGAYYCVEGSCDTAITPTGTFHIGRKAAGLEISPLGELWSPSYFYGGIAIHGSPSIPGYPASHGCVRVPMYAHESLFDQLPAGMTVYVVGTGPPAADVPPPPDKPTTVDAAAAAPPADVPTTTTVPPPPETTPSTTAPTLTAPTTSTSTTPAPTTTTTTVKP